MASYIIDTILERGKKQNFKNVADATKWFSEAAQAATTSPSRLVKGDQARLRTKLRTDDVGRMFMFYYDPKMKNTLPYYDKFPVIFPIEVKGEEILGLNLHYLNPRHRAIFMNELYKLRGRNDPHLTELRYRTLKSASRFKWFRPCIKKYLANHVTSRYIEFLPEEWPIAAFLPVQKFTKASESKVWRDSRNAV